MEPVTVINPWQNPKCEDSKPTLTYTSKCLLSYRGVEVYKNPAGSWDYTYEGMAIAQRAGFDSDMGRRIIDDLLLCESVSMCAEVRRHIASHQGMASP